jgi:dethiobiotin synthetase/adenosylmethionine--8-amino-7-oxononanoate aminotransferase
MKKKAGELLWWPFTQHSLVPEEKITVIDARVGDMFTIYKVCVSAWGS